MIAGLINRSHFFKGYADTTVVPTFPIRHSWQTGAATKSDKTVLGTIGFRPRGRCSYTVLYQYTQTLTYGKCPLQEAQRSI